MRINDLAIGQQKIISGFGNARIAGKLMSMGIRPGCRVKLIRKTNFAKTLYLRIDNFRLALRGEEAALIELR